MNKKDHRQQVLELGLKQLPIFRRIRNHCYECQGNNWHLVSKCDNHNCELWAYRFGFNPFSKRRSNSNSIRTGISNITDDKINQKGIRYNLDLPHQDSIKGNNRMDTSQITKVAPGASMCVKPKKRELPELEENLLYFIYDKLVLGETIFHKSDIENLYVKKYHTAGTKGRKYRLLNAKHNISECINRSKSKHLIIKTKTEINEILRSYGL